MVKDNFFKLLVNFLLFPQNDVSLPLNRGILQLGILEDITDDVHALSNVFPERLGVVNRLFPGSVGIQVSAEVLDFQLQPVLASLVGSLESHVFQEVSGPIGGIGFSARTSINPNTDGRGLSVWMRFGSYRQTIGEGGDLS
jgi:hypothetical protein